MLNRYLLYLTLFLLPLQTRWIIQAGSLNNGPWEYGTISLYILDILIIAAFITLISKEKIDLRFGRIAYRWLLVILLAFLIITLPLSIAPLLSLVKIITLLISILLVYTLAKTPTPFRNNALAFMFGTAISGLVGIWQFLNQSTFASKWLGLASHDPAELGSSVIEAMAPDGVIERWLRAYGTLDHPNMFGGLMATGLIIASWLWLSRRDKNNSWGYILIVSSTVILTAGLVLSFSRASWLGAAAGLIIVAIAYLKKSDKNIKEYIIWKLAVIIVVGLIASQYHYLFTPRFTGDTRLEQMSGNERLDAAKQSLSLIKKHPLAGFGAGAYTLAVNQDIINKRPSWFYQPVHNVFLLISTETGLLGFGLLISSLVLFLIFLYRSHQISSVPLLFALPLTIIIISFFDHWPFSLHFGIILCGALLGLIANHTQTESLTE